MSRRLVVLYGSETGCAAEAAARIGEQASRRAFDDVTVSSMDAFDRARLPDERLVVYVASTTGDGDPPDNMRAFWKFLLRKDLPTDALGPFAVFGLGDSSYRNYNVAARRLFVRLKQLGGTPVCERGLGDDQSALGVEADLDRWLSSELWPNVLKMYPLPDGYVIDDSPRLAPLVVAVTDVTPGLGSGAPVGTPAAGTGAGSGSGSCASAVKPKPSSSAAPSSRAERRRAAVESVCAVATPPAGARGSVVVATVEANDRLTAEDWQQDVRHVRLRVPVPVAPTGYVAGDVAVLYPGNDGDGGDQLKRLAARLGVSLTRVVSLSAATPPPVSTSSPSLPAPLDSTTTPSFPAHLPTGRPVTVGALFLHHLDILATPRRPLLEQLSFFATDTDQREKLLEMCRQDGNDVYNLYCTRERRSLVEVLEDFASVEVPLAYLLQLVPPLQPRSFSIASAPSESPSAIDLCVAVVDYLTPLKRHKLGVCSSWVRGLAPGDEVAVCIKPGTLHPPTDTSAPLLLVGPGTGVAPMRALIRERLSAATDPGKLGTCDLFFGCRHEAKDFLYESEWADLTSAGALTTLHTAFSRDQDSKVYVQHKLGAVARRVYDALITKEGTLYIAGSAKKMPADVTDTITQIIQAVGGATPAQAKATLSAMTRQGRFVVESWS